MKQSVVVINSMSFRRLAVSGLTVLGLVATEYLMVWYCRPVRALPVLRADGGAMLAGSGEVVAMMEDEIPTMAIAAVTDSVIEGTGAMGFRLNSDPAAGSDVYVMVEPEQPEDAAWLPPEFHEQFSAKIPAESLTYEFQIPVQNVFNLEGNGTVTVSLVADDKAYRVGDPDSASVSVTDDEEPIAVSFSDEDDIRVAEGDGTA